MGVRVIDHLAGILPVVCAAIAMDELTHSSAAKQLAVKKQVCFRKKMFMAPPRSDEPPSYRMRIESVICLVMILDLFGCLIQGFANL
jgi:hypothetical protein